MGRVEARVSDVVSVARRSCSCEKNASLAHWMLCVICPGEVMLMTPPQLHIKVQDALSAG